MITTSRQTSPPHLRIGARSWKHDCWKGLVYHPAKRYRPDDYLPDYVRHFTTVEIDQRFWSLFPTGAKLPDPNALRRYASGVSDDFRFAVKAPNAITLTHPYARGQPTEPNPHFLSADLSLRLLATLQPMRGRLGPITFQFE